MTKKINLDTASRDYQRLREAMFSLQLATVDSDHRPEASYAPFVYWQHCCYLFLSDLARHARNLEANPNVSLLIIEDEKKTGNHFARRRIIYYGTSGTVDRQSGEYAEVMTLFRRRFGEFIGMIEPLKDFQLFRVGLESGRFVRGFGQAFELSGPGLEELRHIGVA